MAALWLQSVSLLVLLVSGRIVAGLPGRCTPAAPVWLPPGRCPLPGFLSPKADGAAGTGGNSEVAELAFKDQMEMLVKRGIVERCCHRPCDLFDLQNYCN
ncbi:hypothetical protein L3Q82_022583 [Scortum barcoo]|uniref:Uncharacterized protein n=1 Tax=Scortum barcoo TaxID=214431 RepID=A0ACB8X1U8_9TELE|nr:hypothetical protein L3Q82_022583 [Scortum barcoo]